jgi:cytidylate kinase
MIEPPLARLFPVVTIAALYGAGGGRIASRVAENLGLRFLDRAIPGTVARRAGVPEEALGELGEKPRSRTSRLLSSLGRAAPPTGASGQVERLDLEHQRLRSELEAFLAEAAGSGGVILGRGGAVVLAQVPTALHVYLGGKRAARIERVMTGSGLDRATAAQLVDANDRARRDYVRGAYGVDGDDPSLYHLMLDTVAVGIDASVDLVVAASQARIREAHAQAA